MEKKKEEKILNVYQRINAVMKEVEYVQKQTSAAKGLPYKFVTHDQVTGTLHPQFAKHGIAMVTDIVELKQDGNRTEIKIAATFINIDDPSDRFTTNWYGFGIDNQDKGIGKAVSYAVKYCLLKTFCLETGDDPERDNIDYKSEAETKITLDEVNTLELMINGYDDIRNNIASRCPDRDLSKMNKAQYRLAVEWVKRELKRVNNAAS